MLVEARSKGFDNALVADAMGNVAETATANIFMVRDGEVFTPVANGTFLAGITRSRHISNLKEIGQNVQETVLSFQDFETADEVFMSGNIFSELDAKKLNIVSEISDDLDQSVEEHIIPYLKTAPKAVGEAKALVRSLGATIDDKIIEQTIQQLADIWEGEEARHGIESFLNKNKPRWSN